MKTKIFVAFITLVCSVLFLAGSASAAFATNESGISAYVKAGASINLDQASGAYRIIEDRTSTYIIGTVDVPNSTEYELPHVFTSADGWIMAYYPKEEPRAMIVQWGQYDKNNPDLSQMKSTRLEDAISKVSSAIGIDYSTLKPNTKYYDFQYPDANGLTLIAETRNTNGADSFKFRVPIEFTLYNVSWAYFSYDASDSNSQFRFDGNILPGTDGGFNHNSNSDGGERREERYYGIINALTKDVLHKGDLYYYSWANDDGSSSIAVALIYKEP
jgi:hypothetical protein